MSRITLVVLTRTVVALFASRRSAGVSVGGRLGILDRARYVPRSVRPRCVLPVQDMVAHPPVSEPLMLLGPVLLAPCLRELSLRFQGAPSAPRHRVRGMAGKTDAPATWGATRQRGTYRTARRPTARLSAVAAAAARRSQTQGTQAAPAGRRNPDTRTRTGAIRQNPGSERSPDTAQRWPPNPMKNQA
jgi:hypothetical protein